jgi:uncharacterized membrane protein
MKEPSQTSSFEPRWPVVLTIIAVILMLSLLPRYIRLMPTWVNYVVGVVVLTPIAAVGLTSGQSRWLRVERAVTLIFFVVMAVLILANLANILHAMVHKSAEITGLQLLASSIAAWVINVLIFSLLYWQLDRGGPEARVNHAAARKDWFFPQEGDAVSAAPADWRPVFVDYLYLAYQTAAAFSTTDVMPLTPRAKLLMMLESVISLATILVVAARAINILGG